MLAATSRKYLREPRGMGFLYVEQNLCQQLEPAFLDLHAATLQTPDQFKVRGDARRFENWECNVAAKLGMGAAIEYALMLGVDYLWRRIQHLASCLRDKLALTDGVTVWDSGFVKPGIVTFTLEGYGSKEIKRLLAEQSRRINVSTSTFRSTMLDMQARGLCEVVRASVHAYNTEQDIESVVQAIETLRDTH